MTTEFNTLPVSFFKENKSLNTEEVQEELNITKENLTNLIQVSEKIFLDNPFSTIECNSIKIDFYDEEFERIMEDIHSKNLQYEMDTRMEF